MLSWAVKTETAENTDQGPKWLLSEIKDVAISYTAVKWAWQSLLIMIVRNNASAVILFYFLFLVLIKVINDSGAENLTGLKQSTDIVLVFYLK
jgi:hypothetical protein